MPDDARTEGVEIGIVMNLAQLYIPVMAVLYIGGACFLYFYRIDRASHEANLASIRATEAPGASGPAE